MTDQSKPFPIKTVAWGLGAIASLFAAAYAFDARYMPREVTEVKIETLKSDTEKLIADIQTNQLLIQKNARIQNAQQWLWYWQQQVQHLERVCGSQPNNQNARYQLQHAKAQRDRWHQEVNRLMQ